MSLHTEAPGLASRPKLPEVIATTACLSVGTHTKNLGTHTKCLLTGMAPSGLQWKKLQVSVPQQPKLGV